MAVHACAYVRIIWRYRGSRTWKACLLGGVCRGALAAECLRRVLARFLSVHGSCCFDRRFGLGPSLLNTAVAWFYGR